MAQRLAQATHTRLCRLLLSPGSYNIQGPVAQRLAQGTHNSLVAGSIPAGPTKKRLGLKKPERFYFKIMKVVLHKGDRQFLGTSETTWQIPVRHQRTHRYLFYILFVTA